MCGIAGFITDSSSFDRRKVLERMTESIRHRGPDGGGYYVDSSAALGHRRLSIVDVAAGQQPMANENENLWLVYNGEIYNHGEMKRNLERAGHRYKSRCDTETILHAYEEYGPDCLFQFRGMFAFALWDKHSKTLFCARDRLGIKPFYYYWDGRLFAFASEIKALLEHPAISPKFEETLLSEYLAFGYSSDERTLFAGIRKLMPGHYLMLSPEGLMVDEYWDVPAPVDDRRHELSWIRECRERLETTVKMRLMSDVPLGVFLSGGVDSSAIASLMARMVSEPVKTFAVGYSESAWSELPYARRVAQTIGTDHHEVIVGMEDFFNALPNLIGHEDEPITWPSSVSLYFVSKLAAQQVKVVLTGEGADEMFGGYSRYRFFGINQQWARGYGLLPPRMRKSIRETLASTALFSSSVRRKLQHTFIGRGGDLESLYLDNFYSAFSRQDQSRLLSVRPASTYQSYLRYWGAREGSNWLDRLLYADMKTYLVELLMKQDQMSMACSIESRVPFLDHPFVEFAMRVPEHMKIHRGCGKYILKRAVEDLLPHDIIYRKKMGFPTPLRQWLLNPRSDDLFAILRARGGLLAEYVDRAQLDLLLIRHRNGFEDATDRIWRLLNLQIWGDLFLTGREDAWREGLMATAS
jgi:asparagine synthase (glutamine-hydrolysing)